MKNLANLTETPMWTGKMVNVILSKGGKGYCMPKPSIGTAQIPVPEKEEKPVIQELTVLEEGSKESIYNLIFSEEEK